MSKLGKFLACSLTYGGVAAGTAVAVKKLKLKKAKETRVFKTDEDFVDYVSTPEVVK